MDSKKIALVMMISLLSVYATAFMTMPVHANPLPGTDSNGAGLTPVTMGSIIPVVTEVGKISVSLDALGTNDAAGGTIDVQKPAGATVKVAYMAVATTGFLGYKLAAGDVKIDGNSYVWSIETPSSISSWNYWGDVTSLVKSKIDSAPAGLVNFSITEVNTYYIDGEILVVVFNDPTQTTDNTIILLFGAQDVTGDTFHIGLAQPLNLTDPNLQLDLSLGISYGYQDNATTGQYSIVDVNNVRMTTSAGGEDDGAGQNGALITVGGIGDSNANPTNAYATPTNFRDDDELYSLLPFVNTGDTKINVTTQNPSTDDNIFFAALNLTSTVAVVGEGIVIAPASASNEVGTQHTLTATVQDNLGNPIVGREVNFEIKSGPNAETTATGVTDGSGHVSFSYTGTSVGTDVIVASFMNSTGQLMTSNEATKVWTAPPFRHDVAVTDVSPDADWVYQGKLCHAGVNVTVTNLGETAENFTVTLFAVNETATPSNITVGTQAVLNLLPNATLVLRFVWNSSGAQPCHWYNMTAVASTVPGEIKTENNVCSSPVLVKVRLLGDVNGDGKVDMTDVGLAATAFGESTGDRRWLPWGPYADITNDGKVDLFDIAWICKNWGKTCV